MYRYACTRTAPCPCSKPRCARPLPTRWPLDRTHLVTPRWPTPGCARATPENFPHHIALAGPEQPRTPRGAWLAVRAAVCWPTRPRHTRARGLPGTLRSRTETNRPPSRSESPVLTDTSRMSAYLIVMACTCAWKNIAVSLVIYANTNS